MPIMRKEEQVDELFLHLNPIVSFIDFGLIELFIKRFGSCSLKKDMRYYCSEMKVFMKETTIKQLINHLPGKTEIPPKFSLIEAKIGQNASECTLEELNTLRKRYCSEVRLSEIVFHLVAIVESNSFIVRWLVPSILVSDIMKSTKNVAQTFYQKYKITSLTVNGMWLFLSEAEVDAIWSKIHVSDTKFKDQFYTVYKQMMFELRMQKISEHQLSLYFMSLKYQQHISEHLSRAFLKEELLISLVDFSVLTTVIERFGSDYLKRVMKSYCKYMTIFTKQSTAQQLINVPTIQSKLSEHFKVAKCRIMEDPSHCRLEKLFTFQTRFCMIASFSEVCFVMGELNTEMSGSFTVSWLVPSPLISDIMKSIRSVALNFYQEYKITSLTLDGMWLFLNEAEIDAVWSLIHIRDTNFKNQFHIMYKQIVCELEIGEISDLKLSIYLMKQRPKVQSNASVHLNEAFLKRDFPLSILDFRILKTIIERFGSNCLKKVMKSYCNCITSIYTKQSTAQQLIDLHVSPVQFEPSEYFVPTGCRIMEEPSKYKLEKLLNFQTRLCSIVNNDDVCFIMHEIKIETSVSFIVSWLVLSNIAFDLLKSANQIEETKLFKKFNIASLHLGSSWLYHHQLTPFGTKLKEKYQQSQGSPSPVEWIPSPTKKIFRLAMIQRDKVQRGHIEDRFVRMTISGSVDDILHAKSPVELENIFRNGLHGGEIILIEGAPGSGKSTLTVHICQRWSKGELFLQFTVVILVQLRDPAVQRAQTIADLLPVENAQEIAAELIATNGRGVLWVLDGWDELPPHLQRYSIFHKLVRRMLSESSVIVTSRPISSGDLHPVVSSRIEVLGFTAEEQIQYFTECLKGDMKALEALLEKIQENPVVQSICYLPLNAAFVVYTFKLNGQLLPHTMYEIYVVVILSCIQRHFEREGRGSDLPGQLASLDDISKSESAREPFQHLCELSYHGVMENKVTFSSSDLPQGSNTLGLLQAIQSFLQNGMSMFYNFLHLSIQEVLSAYYIATWLSDSEQVSQFQQLFNQPRFAAVFQFYAAITKLRGPGIRQVIDRIVVQKSKPLLVSLLHCLLEAQDPSLCLYVAERLKYKLDLNYTPLSLLTCLSVNFFLSSITGKKINVDLCFCCINDLGVKCLTKNIDHIGGIAINLSGNTIHEDGVSHIVGILYTLVYVNLSQNPIGDTGTSLMSEAIKEASLLKSLYLNDCGITSGGASYISRMLYYIDELCLSGNPIGDTSGISLISESIKKTRTLKILSLSRCGITSSGAEELSRALAQNSSLEELDISSNNLGDKGISHMAKALKHNKQLKELWISRCGMTDRGATFLASALSVNNSVKMVHIGAHKRAITEDGISTIIQSLANNSASVKLTIPWVFRSIAGRLSQEINEARKRNRLPPIEIEG